ncbi:urease accessory protein UreE [Vineibacter terrae]|uniref:urease accessory protein UreE n=1 Tax=Vineibacter terrae TaxID=2586908 RepID=UPI002E37FEB7|nr:urease accessory protein UreE [Vineibacter terrae]HEX2886589.1 urease accessory protein UreE [Vineibacter terrae]
MSDPLVIESIIGDRGDPALAERLHEIGHHGVVETLVVDPADLPRRRFHSHTDAGTACFVALPRSARLFDGAVVWLEGQRVIVVRVGEQRWLRLAPGADAALELGYLAGNLHWRVRFDGDCLLVAVDGPIEAYLARLKDFQQRGKVRIVE